MSHYRVGCDAHRRYSQFAILDQDGQLQRHARVDHEPGAIRTFLCQFPAGTPVALETVGNWYCLHLPALAVGPGWRRHRWIVDEIACPGRRPGKLPDVCPILAHAAKAKGMMGYVHKTDKLDAEGLGASLHPGLVRQDRQWHSALRLDPAQRTA